jgi:cytoskeleton protein RodZ
VEVAERFIEIVAAGDDVLRISFSGQSWIEINDVNANQIHRDIRLAGDVLEIRGRSPFNILLGDATFARLTFNGAEINVSDNIRIDNSARLTVGP